MRIAASLFRLASVAALAAAAGPRANAGDVAITVNGGTLVISDSSGSDVISVDQVNLPKTRFRATPQPGTTINGSASAVTFSNVTKGARIKHSTGSDAYTFTGAKIAGDVRVEAGTVGDCAIVLTGPVSVARDLTCKSRGADFVVNATSPNEDIKIGRDVRVTLRGGGTCTFVASPMDVKRDVRYSGGDGVDVCVFGSIARVRRNCIIDLGEGINTFVDAATTRFRDVKVSGGDGTNTAVFTGVASGDASVSFGDGDGNTTVVTATVQGALRAASGGHLGTFTVAPTTTAPYKGIRFDGGDGNTSVNFGPNVHVSGTVDLRLGNGGNTFNLNSFVGAKTLSIRSGAGSDSVTIGAATIRDVKIDVGAGGTSQDSISMSGTTVKHDLVISGGIDKTNGTVTNLQVGKNARIDLGNGDNTFTVAGGTFGSLSFFGTTGDDHVTWSGTVTTNHDATLLLGAGENVISIATLDCGGDLVVRTGNGNDMITLTNPNVQGATDIDLGLGTNTGP